MIAVLLIGVPAIAGVLAMLLPQAAPARLLAMLASLITLALAMTGLYSHAADLLSADAAWLPALGSRFSLSLDGMGKSLVLLTGVAYPIIFASTWTNQYSKGGSFYGLMLLGQAGLMGVFLATDCLLFYFFWELALIPAYFLCSIWGGEKRIQATFKFFIYTFVGSLLMLVGILYLYSINPDKSFAMQSFYAIKLSAAQQSWLFWLFFIAFAIKMPVFPFHTWQPDAYEQSPTAVTMVLSGVMVKMGLFAVVRWLLPLFPLAAVQYQTPVLVLCITGILYASLIAMRQNDLKRLIAYSSIAHIGLMCAGLFTGNAMGLQGVMVQMFNHGVNVIGLWIVADTIEKQLGIRKLNELGGIAHKAPVLTIMLVVLAFANIALPLTNAFVGEFMLFNSLFRHNPWMAFAAGISIILGAVYTLAMVQKIFYGPANAHTEKAANGPVGVTAMLGLLVILILMLGVWPQPMIDLTNDTVATLMAARR